MTIILQKTYLDHRIVSKKNIKSMNYQNEIDSIRCIFYALSESGIKKMEDNFLDPSWVEILPAASIILVIHQPVYSVSMSFQKYAIYTVR